MSEECGEGFNSTKEAWKTYQRKAVQELVLGLEKKKQKKKKKKTKNSTKPVRKRNGLPKEHLTPEPGMGENIVKVFH